MSFKSAEVRPGVMSWEKWSTPRGRLHDDAGMFWKLCFFLLCFQKCFASIRQCFENSSLSTQIKKKEWKRSYYSTRPNTEVSTHSFTHSLTHSLTLSSPLLSCPLISSPILSSIRRNGDALLSRSSSSNALSPEKLKRAAPTPTPTPDGAPCVELTPHTLNQQTSTSYLSEED